MPKDRAIPETRDAEDHAAIVDVIRAETQAFVDLDFEAWCACWLHSDRTRSVCVSPAVGFTTLNGWSEIEADMKRVLTEGTGCGMVRFGQDNHRIDIRGDLAWAVFDGWAENGDGGTWDTFETRILERDDGAWRFVYSAFVIQRDNNGSENEVAVDADGHLVGARPECLARLNAHPVFTLSSGRVRATRRTWDKVLQREFTRASRYHDFYQHHRFSMETGGPLQYPVVLGETDEGGLAIASISVRDCVTYLRLDGDAQIGRRLQVAKAVFGLSDAQARLAELIANGDGLKAAAETLGISVNTARTHLARIYEKTGVNAQTALVRLLLSVG